MYILSKAFQQVLNANIYLQKLASVQPRTNRSKLDDTSTQPPPPTVGHKYRSAHVRRIHTIEHFGLVHPLDVVGVAAHLLDDRRTPLALPVHLSGTCCAGRPLRGAGCLSRHTNQPFLPNLGRYIFKNAKLMQNSKLLCFGKVRKVARRIWTNLISGITKSCHARSGGRGCPILPLAIYTPGPITLYPP